MTFTFTDKDGNEVQDIRQCKNCDFIQIRRHFGEDGECPMCQSSGLRKL